MKHTVKKGESLYSIAKQYQTTVKQLMELNGLNNTLIQVGEQLLISTSLNKEEESITYQMFQEENRGKGILKIQALIGDTYFPIANVKIEVSKTFQDGKQIFYSGYTEESGFIDSIVLPTPKKRKDYQNGAAIYQIDATHPAYQEKTIEEVFLYDGIKSIQKIELIPKSYSKGKDQANE